MRTRQKSLKCRFSLFRCRWSTVSIDRSEAHDPLRLDLMCDSPNSNIDIVFVHGLVGTARKTWGWNGNADHFWPTWFADEDDSPSYIIFTFGYNSNCTGAGINLNIIDFAKDPLFHMWSFSGDLKRDGIFIGGQPLVLIANMQVSFLRFAGLFSLLRRIGERNTLRCSITYFLQLR